MKYQEFLSTVQKEIKQKEDLFAINGANYIADFFDKTHFEYVDLAKYANKVTDAKDGLIDALLQTTVESKDFEKLGYTHEESIELAKLTIDYYTNPDIDFTQFVQPLVQPTIPMDTEEWDRIVEAFNNVGELYPISADDLKKALERFENESN